ncbi:HtaA domain-containing protein, partial [Streptomyces cacaoi]|uniref:HtaA domain-containing protein n=1 Tax=Streptomyces cacaoi TaxID=1898 RepID=UPI001F3DBCC5
AYPPVHDGPGVHDIHDAAVDWGIRRTFREYVTGSVARGRWRLSDGARDGGALFRFPAGEGEYDARRHTLTARFSGAVHFRGERLDLRLAAFSVRIEDGTGTLTAEVTREGRTRHRQRLVTFRASDKELEPDDDGLIALDEVPAALTRQGAAAFDGMYAEGATMDPVSLAVALDDDARLPPLPDLGSGADPRADSSHAPGRTVASSSASASSFPWLAGAAAAAALLAAAAFTLHRSRSRSRSRRRAPASAPSGEGSTEGSAGHGSAAKDASAPAVSAKGAPAGDAPAPAAPANEDPVAGASAPDAALASDAATSCDGPVQGAPAEGGSPAGDASAPAAPAKGGPVPDGPASDAGAPGRPSDARPTRTPPAGRDPGRP